VFLFGGVIASMVKYAALERARESGQSTIDSEIRMIDSTHDYGLFCSKPIGFLEKSK
jgi:hypothetical protein